MSLDPPIEASPGGGDHLFVRQATGLVRELSLTDNVVLSASYISVFLGVTYLTLVPSTFTGANIALAFALTFALCVPHFVTYGWLSSAMPRSGGDYLFLSRVVHPLAGFVVNGIISLVFIAGLGNVAPTTFVSRHHGKRVSRSCSGSCSTNRGSLACGRTSNTSSKRLLV